MFSDVLISEQACIEQIVLRDRITAIIPTSQGPLNCLLWTLISFLIRTRPLDRIDHIIVAINGPDRRTGDESLQDQKQQLVEELREFPFDRWSEGLPITLVRAWSRVGHAESLDMVIPWVHTDNFLLMHDDIILNDGNWQAGLGEHFSDATIAITSARPLTYGGLHLARLPDQTWHLGFPHLNTSFLLAKKAPLEVLGTPWRGFHLERRLDLDERQMSRLRNFYDPDELQHTEINGTPTHVSQIGIDIGARLYRRLRESKFRANPVQLPADTITHFRGMSWGTPEILARQFARYRPDIDSLEAEIHESPFGDLYRRWKSPSF